MSERDVFDAALSIPGDAARRAYLDTACAGDEALRRRVDILLHAHEGARLFLERPLYPGPGGDAAPPEADDQWATKPTEELRASGGQGSAAAEDDDDETPLDFLEPSAKPGSLGRLAHYEVLEVVGRGGFGTVVRAFDERLHRMVAIKVMARGLAATSPPRKRFLREARASAAIRHANVVSIHAVDEQPIPYLVMEYIAGPTLQAKLDRSGPIEIPEVLRIGHQIADGLAAAHRQGLIHRDIKPANILLEDAVERVKITDFGLARAADDASLTQSGTIAGTPMYMAPEQAHGEAIDQRADLFSLGSVLYVMCTGRPPFRAPSTLAVLRRVAEDTPRPIHEIIPEVPEELCALIARLHAKDPADRFSSAEEVADLLSDQLEALRAPRGVPPTVAPPRSTAHPKPTMIDSELMTAAWPRSKKAHSEHGRPRPELSGFWAKAAALVLAVILLVQWAGTSNIRRTIDQFFWPRGTLVVKVDDPDAGVSIVREGEGESLVINGPVGQRLWNYYLKPGQYQLFMTKGSHRFDPRSITILGNDYQVVHLDWIAPDAGAVLIPPSLAHDLAPWGQFEDPAGDSRVTRQGAGLAITIPTDATRDLNPRPGFRLDAPRVFSEVEGDFAIQVRVVPGEPARPGEGVVYRWAGLVVWADERNFARLGYAEYPDGDDKRPFVDLESFRSPQRWEDDLRHDQFPPTYFRAERHGGTLVLKTSADGQVWNDYKALSIADFPARLRVGVTAIKAGAKEFTARFEGWTRESIGPTLDPGRSAGGLGPWGNLVDPIGGSSATRSGDRLTIAVPGDVIRDLNPTAEPLKNLHAPRTVQAVTGDFTVAVEVPLFPKARLDTAAAPEGRAYQFAGLLIWADRSNFLRFGTARNLQSDDGSPFLTFESFRDSRSVAWDTNWAGELPTRFQAERRGDTLTLKVRAPGGEWRPYKTCDLTGMPAQLYVGVTAVNSTRATFAPEFAGWSLRSSGSAAPDPFTGMIAPAGAPDLGPWGRLVDPLGGSRASRDGNQLAITIPGDSHRHLNPMPWFNLDAPRLLQPATGDFSIRVTQLPSSKPGPADVDKARNDDGYQWAGLVVWADERTFLRFGVGRHPDFNAGRAFLDCKLHRDVKMADEGVRYTTEGTKHLQVDRRGDKLSLQTSEDGQTWSEFKVCDIAGFPAQVQVGVAAINSGTREFVAQLEDWSLRSVASTAPAPGPRRVGPGSAPDLGPWGRLIDPLGGVQAAREGNRLTIAMPADAPGDLNPMPSKNLDAPRVLQAVDGEFKIQVKLLPSPRPQFDANLPEKGHTYHFAGLVIWADERDFLRFGISGNSEFEGGTPLLDLQYFRDLKDIEGDVRYTGDGPMYLQAERRGKTLTLRTSTDGRDWSDYKTCDLAGMRSKIQVGVVAINSGIKPYAPQFEGWSLQLIGPPLP